MTNLKWGLWAVCGWVVIGASGAARGLWRASTAMTATGTYRVEKESLATPEEQAGRDQRIGEFDVEAGAAAVAWVPLDPATGQPEITRKPAVVALENSGGFALQGTERGLILLLGARGEPLGWLRGATFDQRLDGPRFGRWHLGALTRVRLDEASHTVLEALSKFYGHPIVGRTLVARTDFRKNETDETKGRALEWTSDGSRLDVHGGR